MIDIKTTWEDSGYDCDHCGGQILKRTDRETGQLAQVCYQCQMCGCQWTLSGDALRVGHGRYCRTAQQGRVPDEKKEFIPSWIVFLALAVVTVFLIFRGGLVALRFLIPLAIGAFVLISLVRYGREQEWW